MGYAIDRYNKALREGRIVDGVVYNTTTSANRARAILEGRMHNYTIYPNQEAAQNVPTAVGPDGRLYVSKDTYGNLIYLETPYWSGNAFSRRLSKEDYEKALRDRTLVKVRTRNGPMQEIIFRSADQIGRWLASGQYPLSDAQIIELLDRNGQTINYPVFTQPGGFVRLADGQLIAVHSAEGVPYAKADAEGRLFNQEIYEGQNGAYFAQEERKRYEKFLKDLADENAEVERALQAVAARNAALREGRVYNNIVYQTLREAQIARAIDEGRYWNNTIYSDKIAVEEAKQKAAFEESQRQYFALRDLAIAEGRYVDNKIYDTKAQADDARLRDSVRDKVLSEIQKIVDALNSGAQAAVEDKLFGNAASLLIARDALISRIDKIKVQASEITRAALQQALDDTVQIWSNLNDPTAWLTLSENSNYQDLLFRTTQSIAKENLTPCQFGYVYPNVEASTLLVKGGEAPGSTCWVTDLRWWPDRILDPKSFNITEDSASAVSENYIPTINILAAEGWLKTDRALIKAPVEFNDASNAVGWWMFESNKGRDIIYGTVGRLLYDYADSTNRIMQNGGPNWQNWRDAVGEWCAILREDPQAAIDSTNALPVLSGDFIIPKPYLEMLQKLRDRIEAERAAAAAAAERERALAASKQEWIQWANGERAKLIAPDVIYNTAIAAKWDDDFARQLAYSGNYAATRSNALQQKETASKQEWIEWANGERAKLIDPDVIFATAIAAKWDDNFARQLAYSGGYVEAFNEKREQARVAANAAAFENRYGQVIGWALGEAGKGTASREYLEGQMLASGWQASDVEAIYQATPTLQLLSQVAFAGDNPPMAFKVQTPFGEMWRGDATALYMSFARQGIRDPSRIRVEQTVTVATSWVNGNAWGVQLSPNGDAPPTVSTYLAYKAPGDWVQFRDGFLKPVALLVASVYVPGLAAEVIGSAASGSGFAAVLVEQGFTAAAADLTAKVAINGVIGGTIAEVSGGEFAQGFLAAGLAPQIAQIASAQLSSLQLPESIVRVASNSVGQLIATGDVNIANAIVAGASPEITKTIVEQTGLSVAQAKAVTSSVLTIAQNNDALNDPASIFKFLVSNRAALEDTFGLQKIAMTPQQIESYVVKSEEPNILIDFEGDIEELLYKQPELIDLTPETIAVEPEYINLAVDNVSGEITQGVVLVTVGDMTAENPLDTVTVETQVASIGIVDTGGLVTDPLPEDLLANAAVVSDLTPVEGGMLPVPELLEPPLVPIEELLPSEDALLPVDPLLPVPELLEPPLVPIEELLPGEDALLPVDGGLPVPELLEPPQVIVTAPREEEPAPTTPIESDSPVIIDEGIPIEWGLDSIVQDEDGSLLTLEGEVIVPSEDAWIDSIYLDEDNNLVDFADHVLVSAEDLDDALKLNEGDIDRALEWIVRLIRIHSNQATRNLPRRTTRSALRPQQRPAAKRNITRTPVVRQSDARVIQRLRTNIEKPIVERIRRPVVTGPVVTGPVVTGPVVTGPAVTGPAVTGPVVTGPAVTGPAVTGPALSPAVWLLLATLLLES